MSTESLLLLLLALRVLTIVLAIIILGYIGYIMMSFKNMVPFVPTPKKLAKKMVWLAGLSKGDRVIDLGSGTGRIVIAATQDNDEITAVGVERSPLLRFVTKLKLLFQPRLAKRIAITNQDFFNIELHTYTVIFCFITPEALDILLPKFNQLQKGTKIVSYMFPLSSTEGFTETIEQVGAKNSIYVYIKQ